MMRHRDIDWAFFRNLKSQLCGNTNKQTTTNLFNLSHIKKLQLQFLVYLPCCSCIHSDFQLHISTLELY